MNSGSITNLRFLFEPQQAVPLWTIGSAIIFTLALVLIVVSLFASLYLKKRVDIYIMLFAFLSTATNVLLTLTSYDVIAVITLMPAFYMAHKSFERFCSPFLDISFRFKPILIDVLSIVVILTISAYTNSPSYLLSIFLITHGVAALYTLHFMRSISSIQTGVMLYGGGILTFQTIALLGFSLALNNLVWISFTMTVLIMMVGVGYARMLNLFEASKMVTLAETRLAQEDHLLYRNQLTKSVIRVLSSASHNLGTPFIVLSGLKHELRNKHHYSSDDPLIEDLDSSLQRIEEAKSQMENFVKALDQPATTANELEQAFHRVLGLFEHSLSGVRLYTNFSINELPSIVQSSFLHILINVMHLHVSNLATIGRGGEWLKVEIFNISAYLVISIRHQGRLDHESESEIETRRGAEAMIDSVGAQARLLVHQEDHLESSIFIPTSKAKT